MSDYFSLLGLPTQLVLKEESIEDSWRKLAKESRPGTDSSDDSVEPASSDVNEARRVLLDPFLRLEYWLELLRSTPLEKSTAIDEDLMDLFSRVHTAVNAADKAIKQQSAATTALGKALLAKDSISAQLAIQNLLGILRDESEKVFSRFPEFETLAESNDFNSAISALGRLRYVRKWEKECQDRLLALIALD